MKIRTIITLVILGITLSLINACSKKEEKTGHFSFSGGGGGGNLNYEQQALQMEKDDLAKLGSGKGAHGKPFGGKGEELLKNQDFDKIHEGVTGIKKDPNEVIAIVNGENILRLELDRILDKVKNKVSRSKIYTVEKRILDDLTTQLLLKQFIRKENIQIDQNRVEEEINKFRENLKKNPDTKDKSLETVLEERGGSIEELRVALDISFAIDDYLEKTVPEEEIKEYFTKNIGNFNGETVTVSHIFIDTRNIKDEEKLKEAKENIEKIKEKLDKGADFAELAGENSDCPSANNGGQLGTLGRGEMVDEFTETAFATDVNSISEPVKTQFGYHIIKVTGKQEGKEVKYEDTKDKVKVALFNGKTISLIQELNKNADIQILLKETPQPAGSLHGSYGSSHGGVSAHGSMSGGGHASMSGASPHWNVPSGNSPHGKTYKKEKKSSEESIEESFSLSH
ncbi:MAG: peptidylprolyl isomerase [Candidatus Scalinduaceae bacterium]